MTHFLIELFYCRKRLPIKFYFRLEIFFLCFFCVKAFCAISRVCHKVNRKYFTVSDKTIFQEDENNSKAVF